MPKTYSRMYNSLNVLLQVDEVFVRSTDEDGASEKMKECCPGAPFVQFSTKPGVQVEFVNPVPHNGLFSRIYSISDGDTHAKVVTQLAKDNKAIKSKSLQTNIFFR